MSDSETSRNLSAGVVADLKGLGYLLGPEVDYDKLKEGRTAKAILRFEIVRIDASCFVTAKASELKTPETHFWRWETRDDSKRAPRRSSWR